jgi:hypothetical protein
MFGTLARSLVNEVCEFAIDFAFGLNYISESVHGSLFIYC